MAGKTLVKYALSLPEAWEDHPWGETVAKVGKKVFVFFGTSDKFGMCVKLPTSGEMALAMDDIEPTGYGLGKSGWVTVSPPAMKALPTELLREWIVESYVAVAPKKLSATLRK